MQITERVALLTLFLAACGGSTDNDGTATTVSEPAATTQPDAPATTSRSDNPGTTADAATSDEPSGSGMNTAVITVGDRTYEFEWEADAVQRCEPNFFGGFVAIAATTSDVQSLEAEFPPPDDPELFTPDIQVNDPENDLYWTADPEENLGATVDEWPAQVDSHQIDGNTVSGTATFVNTWDTSEVAPGSFEVTCASEG